MSQSTSHSQQTIIQLIDLLRQYNPKMGSYVHYRSGQGAVSVRLSNGTILLEDDLITTQETNPETNSPEILKTAAEKFVADNVDAVLAAVPLAAGASATAAHAYLPPPKKKNNTLIILLIVLLFLIIVAIAGYFGYQYLKKAVARASITSTITIESNRYSYVETGGISNLKLTLNNPSDFTLDSVKVKVSYVKSDSSIYKNELIRFYHLTPHSTQTLDAPNSDKGTSIKIDFESVSSKDLDL